MTILRVQRSVVSDMSQRGSWAQGGASEASVLEGRGSWAQGGASEASVLEGVSGPHREAIILVLLHVEWQYCLGPRDHRPHFLP